MYNDFKLIDNEKMMELKNAYESKLHSVKSLNINENDFSNSINLCVELLNNANHYLYNLIKTSKNAEILQQLKDIEEHLLKNIQNIKSLYDINEDSSKNDSKINISHNNLIGLVDCLVSFLEKFYDLISVEDNLKIKVVLDNIFYNILSLLKKINFLNLSVANYKVLSLFRRNF